MNQADDLELIQEFKKGNEQAFNKLVLRYQEKVYWVVRRFIPDHDDANDVAQNVFVKAYQSLHSFKGESSFYTWVYRIAVNLSLNEIRRKKVRKIFSIDDERTNEPQSGDDHPLEKMEKAELKMMIQKAVDRLPEKQKKVFILRYFEELPYDDISVILKTSVGGLKANYFHAVKKIGEMIKNEQG
ncbi:MAG: sigma-70 family RNA polymerase sigma factor [Bacteroidota bacterium]|jgi:RNA polymerase sigma-70 factor (ECF subfamily)